MISALARANDRRLSGQGDYRALLEAGGVDGAAHTEYPRRCSDVAVLVEILFPAMVWELVMPPYDGMRFVGGHSECASLCQAAINLSRCRST
jgi:hypothetical protein